jgi:chaperonin cofactor prefoldin
LSILGEEQRRHAAAKAFPCVLVTEPGSATTPRPRRPVVALLISPPSPQPADVAWQGTRPASRVLVMAIESDLRRRVSRLENETESIYEMLDDVQATLRDHSERFDRMDARLDGIDGRLDRMDARLDRIDSRLDRMDARFDGLETSLVEVLRRLPEAS